MRRLFSAALLIILMLAPWEAGAARPDMDMGFFYRQLAPFGRWVDIPKYGWAWSPSIVPIGWRPYMNGRWVRTEEGMTWIADEEWGWITFHYGRWIYEPDFGWLWIPGSVWSPGWVAWRRGSGLVGWAALPPDMGWAFDSGFDFNRFDYEDIDYFWWSFVNEDDLFSDKLRERIYLPAMNDGFLRHSENITRYKKENGRLRNEVFDEETIARLAGRFMTALKFRDEEDTEKGRLWRIKGNEIAVFRPTITGRFFPPPREMVAPTPPPSEGEPARAQGELENLLIRQQSDHEQLDRSHRRQLEAPAGRLPREQIFLQQRSENQRLEEQHNREMRQFENRYRGGSGAFPFGRSPGHKRD